MIKAVYDKFEESKKAAIEGLKNSLAKLRTGRASLALLDGIRINYYGVPTPLKQVAAISTPEPRLIVVQPWEQNLTKEIEKEIQKSDLGVTPVNDGKIVRINIPPLTEDRRKDLVKVINKNGEECKVGLRAIRRDLNKAVDDLFKDKKISEDESKQAQEKIQQLLDKAILEADKVVKDKVVEVQEV